MKPENKVLLINPNRMEPAVSPLGLEMVADGLTRSDVKWSLLDLFWERAPIKSLKNSLADNNPAVVGISIRNIDDCYYASKTFLLSHIKRYVKTIRGCSDAKVVLGGVGFGIAPGPVLDYLGADYGIRGDGEESFPELVKSLVSGDDISRIEGLVVSEKSAPSPAVCRLNGRSGPARGLVQTKRYFDKGGQGNIETQRGCNRKCIYCADPVSKGRKPRFWEPAAVVEQFERLLENDINVLHLCDSEFNVSKKHAQGVCEALIRSGVSKKIKWYAYAMPSPMDDKLARLMKRAGCVGMDFGADSASARMLSGLGRDFGPKALEKCADACKKAGLIFMYDLLIGGPGETRETMKMTIDRLKKIRPHRAGVSFGLRLFPETSLHEMIRTEGGLSENPCIYGHTKNNDSLLKPIFYVTDTMGRAPEKYLKKLIDDDPIFLFAASDEFDKNYNYNDNKPLVSAIRKGARGAYWDILRRTSSGEFK
jgi:radical SAM superfamily enzyme YgiQ (UPF0313 family)